MLQTMASSLSNGLVNQVKLLNYVLENALIEPYPLHQVHYLVFSLFPVTSIVSLPRAFSSTLGSLISRHPFHFIHFIYALTFLCHSILHAIVRLRRRKSVIISFCSHLLCGTIINVSSFPLCSYTISCMTSTCNNSKSVSSSTNSSHSLLTKPRTRTVYKNIF